MKTYWEMEVQLHSLLTSAIDVGECLASCHGRFTPGKRTPVPISQEVGWAPEPV